MNSGPFPVCRAHVLLAGLTLACAPEDPSGPPSEPPPSDPLNLVLVVLDTTRPDYLSAYGHPRPTSPFLDTFAAQATRFDRAYSSSSWTLPAHSTMFSGALPGVHRATQSTARIAEGIPLLAETLSEAGYVTGGFSFNPWVSKKSGLQRGFQTFESVDSVKLPWLSGQIDGRKADRSLVTRRVTSWLRDQQPGEQPLFLFVNLMRSHHPYIPSPLAGREFLGHDEDALREAIEEFYPELPFGRARSLINRHYGGARPFSAEEWSRLTGLYEASLRSADDDLRGILAAVDRWSDPDETLVLVVSDHGESFGEHGHFGHILNLYETSVRVAFLARGPGFAPGTTAEEPVHLADVHATLLGAAHIAPPTWSPGPVGVDLARQRPPERIVSASLDRPAIQLDPFSDEVVESGVLDVYRRAVWAAIGRRYKLIARSDGTEELYDLAADPGETRPIDPATIDERLLAALRSSVDEARSSQASQEVELDFDEETLESLRALGYVK